MTTPFSRVGTRSGLTLALLVAAGLVSLPVVAAFLDGPSTDDLIVPAQIALMAVAGALIGYLQPGIAGAASSSARSAGFGALVGVAAALVGVAVFFLLMNGSSVA